MSVLKFDELNKLRSEPFDEYFSKMELTMEQKNQRIKCARQLEEIMLYILNLADYMLVNSSIDREYLADELSKRYFDIAYETVIKQQQQADEESFVIIYNYLQRYTNDISKKIVDSTFDNTADYYLSTDRARSIAENEANTTLNYSDFELMKRKGKKFKTWVDIRDNRERQTHLEVGGTTISIDEPFQVGSSLMMYPKDKSLNASDSEIANCRCSIRYS